MMAEKGREDEVHLACRMHEAHSRSIEDWTDSRGKLWTEINRRPTKAGIIAITTIAASVLVVLFALFYEGIHSQTRDILTKVGEQDKCVNETMKEFNQEMTKMCLEIKELQVLVRRANGYIDRGTHDSDPN